MPPKMGLRVSSFFHNAFPAVNCQEFDGNWWPLLAESRRSREAASASGSGDADGSFSC